MAKKQKTEKVEVPVVETPIVETPKLKKSEPKKPNWTYVISNQAALYAPYQNDHQSFELHSSEENNLVIKILQLAGVAIKDFNLSQAAAAKEANTIQQEKQ